MANQDTKLHSLKPEEVLTKLDLDKPGLESVKTVAEHGDRLSALDALRTYYRLKYPLPEPSERDRDRDFKVAV